MKLSVGNIQTKKDFPALPSEKPWVQSANVHTAQEIWEPGKESLLSCAAFPVAVWYLREFLPG